MTNSCEHSEDVLLCSCGFSRVEDPTIEVSEEYLERWGGLMQKHEVQREWKTWTPEVRDAYHFYRDIAIEFEDDRVLCANFAVEHALREQRLRACGVADARLSPRQESLL